MAVHEIAQAMSVMGHEVHVLYSCTATEPLPKDMEVPYHVHVLPYWSLSGTNLNLLNFPWKLHRLIREEKFDVVYGHSVESCFISDICRLHRIPFTFIFHAIWMAQPKGSLMNRLLDRVRYWDYYLLRRAIGKADNINTFSNFAKETIKGSLGEGISEKITIRKPGITSSWFKTKRQPGPGFQIIYWGRLEPVKGVDYLISGFEKVSSRVKNMTLKIIGDGSDNTRLQKMVVRFGLQDRISFLGRLDWDLIQDEASTAHLALFPSTMESFGLVIAEAMVMGLPVAAARSGSVPELIEHDKSGVLFPPRDADAIGELLLDYVRRPDFYEEIGQQGMVRAQKAYNWEGFAKHLLGEIS